MILHKIVIENFRCFIGFTINLAPKVSVVIGRNGAGKSSFLKALLYALSFVFSKEESLGQELLVAGNYDLGMPAINKNEFFRRQFNGIPASIANIHAEGNYMGANLCWDITQKNFEGEKPEVSRYSHAYKVFMDTFKRADVLPVFAFFSDSFPHKVGPMTDFAKEQVANDGSVIRTFGYEQWDEDTTNLNIWLNRLINAIIRNTQLNNEDKYSREESAYVTKKQLPYLQLIVYQFVLVKTVEK